MTDEAPSTRQGYRNPLGILARFWRKKAQAGGRRDPDSLAAALVQHLERDILGPWFPRCVDVNGGFHENFGRRWDPSNTGLKHLVCQARLSYTSALAADHFQSDSRRFEQALLYKQASIDGIGYLEQELSDPVHGGLFWDTNQQGEKHVYGHAFVVLAGATVYRVTGHEPALNLATQTFQWLQEQAWDADHGGFVEALEPTGEWKLQPASDGDLDRIGTRHGLKSSNAHLHLLEAFLELFQVRPDGQLREQLEALLALHLDVLPQQPGFVPPYFLPDWTPVSETASFGHDLQTAWLLLETAEVLGGPWPDKAAPVARTLLDHSLARGWDGKYGGFYLEAEPGGAVTKSEKVWWVQAEAINLFSRLPERGMKDFDPTMEVMGKTWSFIQRRLVDRRYGGWYGIVSRSGRRRLDARKAHPWKAAYHETRALLNAGNALRAAGDDG